MRSAEDLRARWLDLIAGVMERTGMYAATGAVAGNDWPAETAAIAALLRQVNAADPSQSLRRPGR